MNGEKDHSCRQIRKVETFAELTSDIFGGAINAFCLHRQLTGDFGEIVGLLEDTNHIQEVDEAKLQALVLTKRGDLARQTLLEDLRILKEAGASPSLNLIKSYERDDAYPPFPTDVYSWHVDRSPVPTYTYLCTYYGNPSDILPNDQGIQKVLVPEIRKELQTLHDGDEVAFEAFLEEYFFDLHYQALPDAQPINLGIGNVWRLAVDHPESPVLPCIHRAPVEQSGETRLLLIC